MPAETISHRNLVCCSGEKIPPEITPMLRVFLTFGLLAVALPAVAQEKLTKVEIGKRGKAATAFFQVPNSNLGTAFCIDPSGLFATGYHLIRRAERGEVSLVLNPSLEGQKVVKAKVVAFDAVLDVALLRVEGVKDLPSLTLGTTKDLAELSELVVCGFPVGFSFSKEKETYPAAVAIAGTVSALRLKDRELESVRVDLAHGLAFSGGPLLDEQGKLVAIAVADLSGFTKGIDKAIPVTFLDRLVNRPEIAFAPSPLTRETLGKPVEFRASVSSFLSKAPDFSVKLELQAGDAPARIIPMKKSGTAWVTTAVPYGAPATPRLQLSVQFGTSSVTGTADDLFFTIAGRPARLRLVQTIEFKEKPSISFNNTGTIREGELGGLGAVEIDLGGQKVTLDLAKATKVTVQVPPEVTSVLAIAIASVDGKEVGRVQRRLTAGDKIVPGTPTKTADPSSVKIAPPALDTDKVSKRLPGTYSEVALGGAGRYLIFQMPKLKKLAIFDVNEARVTKYIPLTEDDIAFAAGLDSIVVGLKKSGKLERWSLTTSELEKTFTPPFSEAITSVALGHASNGPVVVNGQFLELDTFGYSPLVDDKTKERPNIGGGRIPSADGTVYTSWNTQLSPSSSTTFVVEGGVVKRYEGGEYRHVVPGPDGRTMFTGKGIAGQTLQRAGADDANYGYCLPAVRGEYFLSLTTSDEKSGGGFAVHFGNLKRPIGKLDKAGHGLRFDGWDRDPSGPWKRAFLIPDAKVIAVLPASNDQVVLHKFDAEEALEKSGEDYLLVTSRPAREAKAGTAFNYVMKVKSKRAGITYKLESGPKGMVVSAEGVVTWPVPADAMGDQDVILTVRDKAGAEVFHTFTLTVAK